MTEDEKELLEQADESLAAAKLLLNNGYPGYAASRAYYAMFYVAQAFLEKEGQSASTHKGVMSLFGQFVNRSNEVSAEFHSWLGRAAEIRHDADYGPRNAVTLEKSQEQIDHAEKLMQLANRLIAKPHYQKLYEQYARQVGNIANQTQVDYQIALNAFQDGLIYQDVAYVLAQSPKTQELKTDLTKAKEYVKGILQQVQANLQLSQDMDTDLEL